MKTQRKTWSPQIERDAAGFLNGCLPQDDFDTETVEELENSAVSFETLYATGEMPVVKWNDEFERYLDRQGDVIEDMLLNGNRCVWPWEVLRNLPAERKGGDLLYYSQGNRPSCMGHADDFAFRSSLLSAIGLGAPLVYEPTNAYVAWVLSKNGSERGGQSPGPMAKAANEFGHFLVREIGDDNLNMPSHYKNGTESAKRHQSGIVFIPGQGAELADRIRRCNRAGLGVALGNSLAVSGTTLDENNVEIAVLGGRWAHATSFNAWMRRGNCEYVFWTNSHGKRYVKPTFGEPADGCWMRVDRELCRFIESATGYGQPYAVLPEAVRTLKKTLSFDFDVPLPTEFSIR